MNKVLQLANFFQMQKPIGCGTTIRKCQLLAEPPTLQPPRTNACIGMKMTILLYLLYIFWHDFIMGVIA